MVFTVFCCPDIILGGFLCANFLGYIDIILVLWCTSKESFAFIQFLSIKIYCIWLNPTFGRSN